MREKIPNKVSIIITVPDGEGHLVLVGYPKNLSASKIITAPFCEGAHKKATAVAFLKNSLDLEVQEESIQQVGEVVEVTNYFNKIVARYAYFHYALPKDADLDAIVVAAKKNGQWVFRKTEQVCSVEEIDGKSFDKNVQQKVSETMSLISSAQASICVTLDQAFGEKLQTNLQELDAATSSEVVDDKLILNVKNVKITFTSTQTSAPLEALNVTVTAKEGGTLTRKERLSYLAKAFAAAFKAAGKLDSQYGVNLAEMEEQWAFDEVFKAFRQEGFANITIGGKTEEALQAERYALYQSLLSSGLILFAAYIAVSYQLLDYLPDDSSHDVVQLGFAWLSHWALSKAVENNVLMSDYAKAAVPYALPVGLAAYRTGDIIAVSREIGQQIAIGYVVPQALCLAYQAALFAASYVQQHKAKILGGLAWGTMMVGSLWLSGAFENTTAFALQGALPLVLTGLLWSKNKISTQTAALMSLAGPLVLSYGYQYLSETRTSPDILPDDVNKTGASLLNVSTNNLSNTEAFFEAQPAEKVTRYASGTTSLVDKLAENNVSGQSKVPNYIKEDDLNGSLFKNSTKKVELFNTVHDRAGEVTSFGWIDIGLFANGLKLLSHVGVGLGMAAKYTRTLRGK